MWLTTSNSVQNNRDPKKSSFSNGNSPNRRSAIKSRFDCTKTISDLSQRVDSVIEESIKLRSENQVLGQYIQNLMSSSTVFQPTLTKAHPTK